MATTNQTFVYNQDVVGLYARIQRFLEEMWKSVSSNLSLTNEFDQKRLSSYLDAVDRYHAWIQAQPHLDLPETAPQQYLLEPLVTPADVENESVNDVLRLMCACRDELINSQSARLPSGMLSYDSARLTAIVEKTRRFLNDYIATTDPLDLPESTPREIISGEGRKGV